MNRQDYEDKEVVSLFNSKVKEKEGLVNKEYYQRIQKILPLLPDTPSIIDLGCGEGRELLEIKNFFEQQYKNGSFFGCDISKTMTALAKEKDSQFDIRNEDFKKTSFENGAFDLALSRYALQNCENIDDVWEETDRLLKSGSYGVYLITHPISNFIHKRGDYFEKEKITVPITEDVYVTEPTHTLGDWISPYFLSKFELRGFWEGKRYEEKKYPSYFILVFKKK